MLEEHVVVGCTGGLAQRRDQGPAGAVGRRTEAGQRLEGRRQVDVRDHVVARSRQHAGTGHDQRHPHVRVVRRALAAPEAPRAEVVAVVRRQHDVGVRVDRVEDATEHPVDRLHHPGPVAQGPAASRARGRGPWARQPGAGSPLPSTGALSRARSRKPGRSATRQGLAPHRTAVAGAPTPVRPVAEGRREHRVTGGTGPAAPPGRAARTSPPRGSRASHPTRGGG